MILMRCEWGYESPMKFFLTQFNLIGAHQNMSIIMFSDIYSNGLMIISINFYLA